MKIGLCVVGCGDFARTFAESIQPLLSDIDIYFASRDLEKAKMYSHMYSGMGAFGSYAGAATSSKIQAMYICTPHHLHLNHSTLAADSGKHVLVEKPISNTLEQGRDIVSVCKTNNINLMVAENYRFMPAIRLCKKLVDEGAIGNIRTIQVHQESPYLPSGWRTNTKLNGGGVFIDAGIHKIHFLRYLMGRPMHVAAVAIGADTKIDKGEDGLIFMGTWEGGKCGLIYHSWTPSEYSATHWAALTGSEGKIYFEVGDTVLYLDRRNERQIFTIPTPTNGIAPMVTEFLSSIHESRQPEITGEDGLEDLAVVTDAYRSLIVT